MANIFGVIGVGGLLLARIPEELAQSREQYFDNKVTDREQAVENDLDEGSDNAMPINQERQRCNFGWLQEELIF